MRKYNIARRLEIMFDKGTEIEFIEFNIERVLDHPLDGNASLNNLVVDQSWGILNRKELSVMADKEQEKKEQERFTQTFEQIEIIHNPNTKKSSNKE
ncbi:hypothetical protein [Virgibacillus litoralis]|uniref:Uncharacterized protein n=1 Tax=Virgibacillus litoralis TaxID=578221 RepID=A0ABS4HC97_9BACI|nr:hypothetical protein [Virgibacillus litoralis]MBP1948534.1 hypothetical protein [Virgibacillus litoralis]